MFHRMLRAVATLLFVTGLMGAGLAHAGADQAREFVRNLGDEAIALLSNDKLDASERIAGLETLLKRDFDLPRIGRFVLARYWRQASEEQQEEFSRLFESYVLSVYAARLGEYSGETFEITGATELNEKETSVNTVIKRGQRPPLRVDWRVREDGSKPLIVDVAVEGVSMALTHRSEFGSVIQNSPQGVDALLDRLRKQSVKVD
ncbi:MlaC/ttg2D family ABC transporter substrate-binding protein [Oceanibacterium hippocampi]|uniref:Putative phospholipid-binding protein MlaC n=1 Tax=Oceanibacterium hippocampi TaxID=745714 RepID=A0A1Y5SBI8_9PROT|nr:ABC transporter substrate-binding protein [Oceanibacterium hippocampi]SLN37002.1 putative phospholipid-binding protein MlaC precursor [Oceanibacterium hippocampi]